MNEENVDLTPLIDKIQPILTEKQPKGTAITLYCVSIFSFFGLGLGLGEIHNINFNAVNNPYGVAVLAGFILIIIAALTLLSTIAFIKRFKELTTPPNVNKESQKEAPPHAL